MLFKKLFRLLVLGGAMAGTASGCAGGGQAQGAPEKKSERDGGAGSDAGSAKADADGGSAADAGGGGGVVGW
jgi:hypothetical protein